MSRNHTVDAIPGEAHIARVSRQRTLPPICNPAVSAPDPEPRIRARRRVRQLIDACTAVFAELNDRAIAQLDAVAAVVVDAVAG